MFTRSPLTLCALCFAIALGGCDSVNKAFEYASQRERPQDPPAAAPADTAVPPRPSPPAVEPTPTESTPRRASAVASPAPPPAAAPPALKPIVPVVPAYTGPEGEAGLIQGVRDGYLREARRSDLQQWQSSQRGVDARRDESSSGFALHNAYVVLKPYRLPTGLYGAHSARFYVPRGVERPTGELGHSVIYDFNTLTCNGATCNFE
ncbi:MULTISPECIES: hypothetical protein [unclassified Lysobacter]|uniref:hypothetical protein n=1 Tax=unclassified Lysobacter TaxID=2635362 RepID=UPI001BECC9A7|nr:MULTISPECIES: hypothetical protein [unclassified Lysobacter]MBT2748893.1 hypothetical protein [Lysobacter sp. ISL-42]MBT2753079.1 hypothetical protein [Lysobacter sp. ISL-50]MBT2777248.1 hypothetical protein [Lysobacter sp. ISL-54]MBT2783228.1 hypothetical protein [Lysobacter sp. ISL-52]